MQDKPDHRQTQESPAGDSAAPSLPGPLRLSPEELEEIANGDGVNFNCKRLGRITAFGPPCAWEPEWATLLLGEAHNRWQGSNPHRARHALLREDLAQLCGLSFPLDFYRAFVRADLLDYWPGKQGRGSAFPTAEAAAGAETLAPHLHHFRRVVIVGRRTYEACRAHFQLPEGLEWFEPYVKVTQLGPLRAHRLTVAVAPHPSKVNTWWKDPSNVAQARQFWSRVASEIMGPLEAERENRRTKT